MTIEDSGGRRRLTGAAGTSRLALSGASRQAGAGLLRHMAVALVGSLLAGCTAGPATGSEYFVDFARGNDRAEGASTTPWRHAPGDPAATGRPQSVVLRPGDTVRFAGGVAYRGTIRLAVSGSEGRPITLSGSGFGNGHGIIDGSDPATVSACPSAEACGGAPNWQALSLVRFAGKAATPALFDANGPLWEAQSPEPADPFYADDVTRWRKTPKADEHAIEGGRLRAPDLARALDGPIKGSLLFWVRGNEVSRRPILRIEGDELVFDGTGLDLYDDRDGRVAAAGSLAQPLPARRYVAIAPGLAVANLAGGSAVSVGSNRPGLLLQAASNVVVRDLDFRNQSSERRQNGQGISIEARGKGSGALLIAGNRFGPALMRNRQGAIRITDVAGVRIENNAFAELVEGSGVRTGAGNRDLLIHNNQFRRIGRTALAIFGVTHGRIDGNVITDARGIHGNGLSLYLANRDVTVSNNAITGATRPMTFHGDTTAVAPGDHRFIIERNLFVGLDEGQAGLTSWGAATRGVTIRENVLAGPKFGLMLDATDRDVVVEGNVMNGYTVNKGATGENWRIGANPTLKWSDAKTFDQRRGCALLKLPAGASFGGGLC